MRIQKLNKDTKKNLLEDLLKRSPNQYTEYEERVAAIMPIVRQYVAFWREYPDLFVDFL